MTKQYGKAIKFLKEGEKQDDTELSQTQFGACLSNE
jgi:hypothetical protein